MLREREQLKLGETMSRISKWHCGVFIIIINARKLCSSYKQLYPKLTIANINLRCFVCGGEKLTARRASFPLCNWKILMYLVLSGSSFCGGLSFQDRRNLHIVDSGAVNLHPPQCWMTIPNCFTALQHANCNASRNGFPLSHAHRHTPAKRTWLWKVTQPAPTTLSSKGPELRLKYSVVAPKLPKHWGAVWSLHTELEGGGTVLMFVVNCCCCRALKPDFPFTVTI